MTFRVGQEVVYVDNGKPWRGADGSTDRDLVHGQVYVICGMENSNWFKNGLGLHLVGHDKWSYDASEFRPVVKTDISIFTAMLAPAPSRKVLADAYREAAEKWNREHA